MAYRSKLMQSISAAAKAKIEQVQNSVTSAVAGIKGGFVIIGQEIVSEGQSIKGGVVGSVTEAYNILADVAEIVGTGSASIDDKVATVQTIVTNAQTAANTPGIDPTVQSNIIAVLTLAMADAQAALDAKFDAGQKEALLAQFREHEASITEIKNQVQQDIKTKAATIKSHVSTLKSIVKDAWMKKNFNASTVPEHGIILGQEALEGAKEAMNQKYGEGSVSW